MPGGLLPVGFVNVELVLEADELVIFARLEPLVLFCASILLVKTATKTMATEKADTNIDIPLTSTKLDRITLSSINILLITLHIH
jgi:hypothetical protein